MRAGAGISTALDPAVAIEAAARDALASGGIERADFALVLVGVAHGEGIRAVAEHAAEALGTDVVVGVSVEGVMAGALEVVNNPALAVLALEGCEAEAFAIPDLGSDEAGAAAELVNRFGGSLAEDDLVVLFPDPLAHLPTRLLPGLQAGLQPARVVGGAGGCIGSGARSWLGSGPVISGALAGFVLHGLREVDLAVTQACHPVTRPLEVTRSRGNWIYSLDGRPALEVYREAARGPLAEDLQRAARFLMVAIPAANHVCGAEHPTLDCSDFAVRHVVGFDEAREAISLPQPVPSGSRVWLSLLDPAAAREDLGRTLAARPAAPSFGMYFNCRARGESLFGVSGLEAGYLERCYGDAPIVGMSGAFQIAPRSDRSLASSQLLTYAGVLALVSDSP